MALDKILLGLLHEPKSGYDLKAEFDEGMAHFWSADQSQIYATLKRLEDGRLLTSESRPSSRGPARRVYRRTAAGRRLLQEWLAGGPQVKESRMPYLAQLALMSELPEADAAGHHAARVRADFEQRLALLQAMQQRLFVDEGVTGPEELSGRTLHEYCTIRHGVLRLTALIQWCDESIQLLARKKRARA